MRILTIIMILITSLFSEEKYKEPQYDIVNKDGNIEVREYGEYIVARTSINKNFDASENNMFRTLASYIFGDNHSNAKIPMTAPVTTVTNSNSFDMFFYMLDVNEIADLPTTDIKNIEFEKLKLGKCAVISFSWYTTEGRIQRYKTLLDDFISINNLEVISSYMVNRYDPPWTLPFLRRNELLVQVR